MYIYLYMLLYNSDRYMYIYVCTMSDLLQHYVDAQCASNYLDTALDFVVNVKPIFA